MSGGQTDKLSPRQEHLQVLLENLQVLIAHKILFIEGKQELFWGEIPFNKNKRKRKTRALMSSVARRVAIRACTKLINF